MNTRMAERRIAQIHEGMDTSDGAGVDLRRFIGTHRLMQIDPFLLLDEFHSDDPESYIAGFPPHPHRGFETVTYLIHGRMRHRDSTGMEGLLTSGAVQWMTAGRGVIHSEMPEQEQGLLRGLQLWVNLPARDKMLPPRYQDIPPERIPEVAIDGGRVRVIAGGFAGHTGAAETHTPILYLDVRIAHGSVFETTVDAGSNVMLHTLDGQIRVAEATAPEGRTVLLSDGEALRVHATSPDGAHFLVIGGRPIGEPVARGGPFVMNTREEIVQAFADYETGRMGR